MKDKLSKIIRKMEKLAYKKGYTIIRVEFTKDDEEYEYTKTLSYGDKYHLSEETKGIIRSGGWVEEKDNK